MVKMDINGNVITKDRSYLINLIINMTSIKYEVDGVDRYMVECGDGGSIRFFGKEEERLVNYLTTKGDLL